MYAKTRQGQSAAVLEQVSTTVPKSAILQFCPSRETCWGVPSPNPAHAPLRARKEEGTRSEEHTSELQSRFDLVCRLLLEKKKKNTKLSCSTYIPTQHSDDTHA